MPKRQKGQIFPSTLGGASASAEHWAAQRSVQTGAGAAHMRLRCCRCGQSLRRCVQQALEATNAAIFTGRPPRRISGRMYSRGTASACKCLFCTWPAGIGTSTIPPRDVITSRSSGGGDSTPTPRRPGGASPLPTFQRVPRNLTPLGQSVLAVLSLDFKGLRFRESRHAAGHPICAHNVDQVPRRCPDATDTLGYTNSLKPLPQTRVSVTTCPRRAGLRSPGSFLLQQVPVLHAVWPDVTLGHESPGRLGWGVFAWSRHHRLLYQTNLISSACTSENECHSGASLAISISRAWSMLFSVPLPFRVTSKPAPRAPCRRHINPMCRATGTGDSAAKLSRRQTPHQFSGIVAHTGARLSTFLSGEFVAGIRPRRTGRGDVE